MVINHTMTTVTREGGARTNTGSMKKSIHSLTNWLYIIKYQEGRNWEKGFYSYRNVKENSFKITNIKKNLE